MTDQTNRYARRTIKIAGLLKDSGLPEAPFTLEEAPFTLEACGIRWNLFGRNEAPEIKEVEMVTETINGDEFPSGLSTSERLWLVKLAEKNGLDYSRTTEIKKAVNFDVPYIDAPVLFYDEACAFPDDAVQATVTMGRGNRTLTIVLEGDSSDSVSSPEVDAWVVQRVAQVRHALDACGFEEDDVSIDCEVIMGAERTAACDPALMKSMLKEEEE